MSLRLLLLTGSREGEVLKADWTQFDLDARRLGKAIAITRNRSA